MYAAELLIDRLREQIALAPKLAENAAPGGRLEEMLDRLKDGVNHVKGIEALRAVEGGYRRYSRYFTNALEQVEQLTPIFAGISKARMGAYKDQLQADKAMSRFKDTPSKIIGVCEAAIRELEGALQVIDEGDARTARREAKNPPAKTLEPAGAAA